MTSRRTRTIAAIAVAAIATFVQTVAYASTVPGDTPGQPFWPHETGVLVGTSETFVDLRTDGSYYDPSVGLRVSARLADVGCAAC